MTPGDFYTLLGYVTSALLRLRDTTRNSAKPRLPRSRWGAIRAHSTMRRCQQPTNRTGAATFLRGQSRAPSREVSKAVRATAAGGDSSRLRSGAAVAA